MITVLSVGGSIVSPATPDIDFLVHFSKTMRKWLAEDSDRKLIMVVGGGGPARNYQSTYRQVCNSLGKPVNNTEADWIGITATYLNAQLLKACFADICEDPVVYNPTTAAHFSGRVLVAAGWKPGFSTDNDAVLLAERFGAKTVVNLSNIEKVYTDDPRTNPNATPIDSITWQQFIKMVGTEWIPGNNVPFDPIASQKAMELGLKVICASGKNLNNLENILDGKDFIGTTIYNEH